jgi:predicted aldo/keto reductase-like oxidoreductase
MRLLETSLRRLRTDRIDLWQLHNVRTDTDLDFVFSREGAVRALERAQEQGLVRFTGITGHQDPHVLRRAIERYPFDATLLALNAADRHDASFIDHVLPTAIAQGLAVIGMKIPAQGRLLRPDGVRTMEQAMRYALTLPVSTVIVGISTLAELEEDVAIARAFRPYAPEEMAELERLTRPYHADALWYRNGH